MASFIQIGKRKIGPGFPPLVVAEIGINHEGSLGKAKKMVRDAARAGAECVKFQCHVVEDEMIPTARKVVPGNAKESIWNIIRRCTLSEKEDALLKTYVESLGMIYLSTPFSRTAANRLKRMKVAAYKIGSGECNNYPLVEHIASFGKPIILSTGMNDIRMIRGTVNILRKHNVPYAVLHCNSVYPTPYELVRLGAMAQFKKQFKDAVIGYSDHSIGNNYMCFAAVALGASIVEKHFTSDKKWPGPDIPISIDASQLKDLILGSRAIFNALGGKKTILAEEKPTIDFAYACVVSTKTIKKGERFSEKNIWVKRPGTGEIKAAFYKKVLGLAAQKDIEANSALRRQDIKNFRSKS